MGVYSKSNCCTLHIHIQYVLGVGQIEVYQFKGSTGSYIVNTFNIRSSKANFEVHPQPQGAEHIGRAYRTPT